MLLRSLCLILVVALCGAGCSETPKPAKSGAKKTVKRAKSEVVEADEPSGGEEESGSLSFGDSGSKPAGHGHSHGAEGQDEKEQSVVEALQPFQVLLGDWEGKTKKQFDGFARVDNLTWVWDFKTDKNQPAVTFVSDKSPYFAKGWLTYLPEKHLFRLTTESAEKERRQFEGTWKEGGEPKQESDGKKLQWSFKLDLVQVEPAEGEQYRLELAQQENNRYHLSVSRKPARGNKFTQLDVVGIQRKNTSFAVTDSDNPGPKCVVSGGLGTISVSHNGKSYTVCCTGCKAAFEEDPERWIAKFEKAAAEMKKSQE